MTRQRLFFILSLLFFVQIVSAQKSIKLVRDSLNVLHKDEIATVELLEKPSSGYTWHCVFLDSSATASLGKIAERVEGRKEANKEKDVKHLFDFQAFNKGKIILLFELYRDWEGREATIKQQSFPVLVKDASGEMVMRGLNSKVYDWADTDSLNFKSFHVGASSLSVRKAYQMPTSQVFLIDLENRIQGATWIPHISNNSVVELIQDKVFSRSQIAYSMYSLHAFKFITRRNGVCNIRFDLILPDGEIAQSKVLNYQIVVKDDSFDSEIEKVEHGVDR